MRRTLLGILCAGLLLGGGVRAASAAPFSPGQEAGWSLGAMGANLGYFPAKLVVASVGALGGGLAGFLTGGSTRAAYAIWVPTMGGTWLLTPSHLDGSTPVGFFGRDYADTASGVTEDPESSRIYSSRYMKTR